MALSSSLLLNTLLALLYIVAFIIAGFVQIIWFKSAMYQRLRIPIDRGITFLGNPLFGKNKTIGGVIIFCPLVTLLLCYAGITLQAFQIEPIVSQNGTLSKVDWLTFGAVISCGYVFGELINSFIKRRFRIEPGGVPTSKFYGKVFQLIDQIDSVLCSIVAFSFFVSVNYYFVSLVLIIGAIVHKLFNVLLYKLKLKAEPR